MPSSFHHLLVALCLPTASADLTFTIPPSTPIGAALLDSAPVSLSFEFFAFPSYFTNVTSTTQCLENFQALTGTWPPIRIGGTTQDRAVYDPKLNAEVFYSVAAATDAPTSLTFGDSFMSLAGGYEGSVVLGMWFLCECSLSKWRMIFDICDE